MKKLFTITTIILFSGCSNLTAPEFKSPIKKITPAIKVSLDSVNIFTN